MLTCAACMPAALRTMTVAPHGARRCCVAAAAVLAVGLLCSAQAASGSASSSTGHISRSDGSLTAAAAASLQGTHPEDHAGLRQLLANGGHNIAEVGAVAAAVHFTGVLRDHADSDFMWAPAIIECSLRRIADPKTINPKP